MPSLPIENRVRGHERHTGLRGRASECALLDGLVSAIRHGESRSLVLWGEAGIGKSALLEYLVESVSDMTVLRAFGVESEMELPFAALHQVCAPMLDRVELLPAPQRDALGTVFGLSAGSAPDRFMVGLAVLSLFSEAANECPLVCVVDDAQWLDRASAQALTFVARRLDAESVVLLFATRQECEDFRGLPELVVGGLPDAAARELLTSIVQGPLDEQVRERILAEARGNPLALVELPRGLAAGGPGGFAPRNAPPLSSRIEESFLRRLEQLPEETQLLMLLAAAEPIGDPALVWRAAERLGLTVDAAHRAEAAGLLEIGARVRFRHPLVRSAVYHAATTADRNQIHWALAEATDAELDPDRRAWHRAHATQRPDEDVAAELERSAERARARGGLTAAAAFLARAVELTADPACRAQRALAAAHAAHLAGSPDAAERLLATAHAGPLDELGHALVNLLRAQLAYAQNRGRDAPELLRRAAERLEPLDLELARATYLDAMTAAQFAGHLARGGGVREVARAALAAPSPEPPERAADLLLDGLARQDIDGYAAGAPLLKRALSLFRTEQFSDVAEFRWLWFASRTAVYMWDDDAWDELAARHVQLAREAGALTLLPLALNMHMSAQTFTGGLVASASLTEELRAVTEATGSRPPYGALVAAAWQGRKTEGFELIEATKREVAALDEGLALVAAHWASAALSNSLGQYEAALAEAKKAAEHPEALAFYNWGLVELIEGAARSGAPERAADALTRLVARTHASGTDWALGVEARSRALLGEGEVAESLYREAIERLSRTLVRVDLARAHLVYGEWLRRERRRLDARQQLRIAYEMFDGTGLEAFAQRAARELLATGEHARQRTAETRDDLTAQERQITQLACDGLSNPEIGARLFLSPRTVEWHLRKVFGKLGVHRRRELADALSGWDSQLHPA
jgi:DNA-binding CsgD family transcriptional regulator